MTRRTRLVIAAILMGLGTIASTAQAPQIDRAAIEKYQAAAKLAEAGAKPRAVENLFLAIVPLRDALMKSNTTNYAMAALPEDEFRRLAQELPGVDLGRDEIVYVEPVVGYFAKLAAAHGDAADRAFFAALKATYSDGVAIFPVYVDQQTDYSGCTRFGSGSLVDTYRVWSDFQKKFPGRYAAAVKKETDGVVESLESTCACNGTESVQKELQQFLKSFPKAAIRPQIEQRLKVLSSDPKAVRAHCISG